MIWKLEYLHSQTQLNYSTQSHFICSEVVGDSTVCGGRQVATKQVIRRRARVRSLFLSQDSITLKLRLGPVGLFYFKQPRSQKIWGAISGVWKRSRRWLGVRGQRPQTPEASGSVPPALEDFAKLTKF